MTAAMTELTGTLQLIRLHLRRDRIRIVIWVFSIVGLVGVTAPSIKALYPTQAALDQFAAATQHNAAAIAFNGPPQGLDTLGGEVAFNLGAGAMVLVALMSLFMMGRLTRGEEEAGRVELLRSLPVGQDAPTVAALTVVAVMNFAAGGLTSLVLIPEGLPITGSVVFGVSFIVVGLFFSAVALLAAQITESTRAVYGSTGAVLAAAFVMRAVGDVGDGTVSWFSPIGLAQKSRPYAGERWWPFLPLLAGALLLVVAAGVLAARRDHGAGLIAPRPGRPAAARSLGNPIGLAFRLQRGVLIGWAVGVLVTGIAYGWIAPTVDSFIANNKQLAEMMASAGGAKLIDSYFATSFKIMALAATGFAIQSALRMRGEETALRAESVLATPVSRWRWAASHLAVAFLGCVILLAVAGLSTGLSYVAGGGSWSSVPRLFGAAVVYAPAMWLMTGITVVLFGLVPRLVDVAWAVFAGCFVVGFLGAILKIPDWVQKLSPFEHVPELPAQHFTAPALVAITAIAAVFTLVGLGALRRRDIGY